MSEQASDNNTTSTTEGLSLCLECMTFQRPEDFVDSAELGVVCCYGCANYAYAALHGCLADVTCGGCCD